MERSKLRQLAAFPLLLAALVAAAVWLGDDVRRILQQLRATPPTAGSVLLPAAVVVLLQIVQVIVFVIPGEVVQIAAGYLFGVAGGSLVSVAGILVGSGVNYWVGRLLGRQFVSAITTLEQRDRIDSVMRRRGVQVGFFSLFVIPGIPKDVLGYVAGAAGGSDRPAAETETESESGGTGASDRGQAFRFAPFLALSMVGRIPGIVGSALIGSTAAEGRIWLSLALLAAAGVLLFLGLRYQRRIEQVASRTIARVRAWFPSDRSE
jgi:uncharacterized membrane protein YdjX (TVP38/TMEM64 family)